MSTAVLEKSRTKLFVPVNFESNEWDRKIQEMALRGLGADAIRKQVPHLTEQQVLYRVRLAGGIRPYRMGKSPAAKLAISSINAMLHECAGLRRRVASIINGRQRRHGRGAA